MARNPDLSTAFTLAIPIALVLASLGGLFLVSAISLSAIWSATVLDHIAIPVAIGAIAGAVAALAAFYASCVFAAFVLVKLVKHFVSNRTMPN